ncbi:MAG: dTDP-4-dehydrorhamnose 3,5-epimerase [Candidatus Aminicenantes bacterium]|nr:dTDP-4-dehydrorhamnose 3,5-epimerase [Candidatus Aminicenantes bacterium]NIM77181.1 dTDP-4-dehydrorhamnose 3,5-epimerase [Candidatus Aminicenantes bacterium]NIN16474.1 dTDP-4-dehydrorhamnose 3,5-epimerase [Candidatus Aminicenantes bacterium]NIN40335.1 dTDP-4-dehydrorhamnose 3,5-epimerase [Candidatus Aminicenantes bacterium]NIN83154.1 dTDP-4-dehydrorhamnose 3,5-epimerase [Candidatus Aminicenantes bacterium]
MGEIKPIDGVIIKPLKRFPDERGTVMHIMKATDEEFKGFGEVYCSSIYPGVVKGWHYHENVTLNYVVLKGMIKFVLYDEREGSPSKGFIQEIFMGDQNYVRVTVPPGIWNGFKCMGTEPALVCNVIDKPHDEAETRRCDPHDVSIPYDWKRKDK